MRAPGPPPTQGHRPDNPAMPVLLLPTPALPMQAHRLATPESHRPMPVLPPAAVTIQTPAPAAEERGVALALTPAPPRTNATVLDRTRSALPMERTRCRATASI